MEMSAENSKRIISWLNHAPSDEYTKQEFVCGFEEDKVRLPSNDAKMSCPQCLLIPRFPLVLKCGHVSCHICFPEWFKRSRQPKCTTCLRPVVLEEVMTLSDDRLKRPGSLPSKMYDMAMITCTNIGCNKEFNVEQKNNHEFHECPFRIIKCTANNCLYKDNHNGVYQHALECPFLTFYCSTCYSEYGVEVLTHSCMKRLQRQLARSIRSLLGSPPPTLPKQHNGDVIFPSHVTYPPFDMKALLDAQLGLGFRPSLMSSGAGLAPRRRMLQSQVGFPRNLNEVYWRSTDSENDISQFTFSSNSK